MYLAFQVMRVVSQARAVSYAASLQNRKKMTITKRQVTETPTSDKTTQITCQRRHLDFLNSQVGVAGAGVALRPRAHVEARLCSCHLERLVAEHWGLFQGWLAGRERFRMDAIHAMVVGESG